MKKMTLKMVTVLKMSITLMLVMIIFIDESLLNSMVIQYDSNDLVIEEVASTIVDRTSGQLSATVTAGEEAPKVEETVASVGESTSMVATAVKAVQADYWVWPTNGNYIITSYFGYRWGSMHEAIDISGTGYGSSIYAANNGVVATVKGGCVAGDMSCNGRGGNYVVIRHNSNNYYTIYMHLKDIYVSVGQNVSRGQVIGSMGNTGNVSPAPTSSNPYNGTHLHFGLYIGEPYNGGYAVNPMRLY